MEDLDDYRRKHREAYLQRKNDTTQDDTNKHKNTENNDKSFSPTVATTSSSSTKLNHKGLATTGNVIETPSEFPSRISHGEFPSDAVKKSEDTMRQTLEDAELAWQLQRDMLVDDEQQMSAKTPNKKFTEAEDGIRPPDYTYTERLINTPPANAFLPNTSLQEFLSTNTFSRISDERNRSAGWPGDDRRNEGIRSPTKISDEDIKLPDEDIARRLQFEFDRELAQEREWSMDANAAASGCEGDYMETRNVHNSYTAERINNGLDSGLSKSTVTEFQDDTQSVVSRNVRSTGASRSSRVQEYTPMLADNVVESQGEEVNPIVIDEDDSIMQAVIAQSLIEM